MNKPLRIATRKSPLAIWQAQYISAELKKLYPDINIELVKMSTQGDKIINSPLSKFGGKGLFIKELELGILQGKADIAVHSMKDVPYKVMEDFNVITVTKRENPFDAFVSNDYQNIADLPSKARLGSCSMRRILQIKAIRPDLEILDLRGNVNSRLKKLDNNEYDAIIIACAGLIRLGLEKRINTILNVDVCLPAVGQGALAVEIKKNDFYTTKLIQGLINEDTSRAVLAERSMNEKLEGGCSTAVAGYADIIDDKIRLKGLVGNIESTKILKEEIIGDAANAKFLGIKLADRLIAKGARELLQNK